MLGGVPAAGEAGFAAEGAVTVTEEGLANVTSHPSQFGEWAPNQAMVDRLAG